MVFGTVYCPLSRLPIEDGDRCILMPIGFRMKYDFSSGNNADIGHFMNPYVFLAREPIEVLYEGNYWEIKYARKLKDKRIDDSKYEEHELYMLIHYGFYKELQKGASDYGSEKIAHLGLFGTVWDVWEKAKEIQDREGHILSGKHKRGEITADELVNMSLNVLTPAWIIEIYKVAYFMQRMNMIPYANCGSTQGDIGVDFEKYRASAIGYSEHKAKNE